MSTLKQTLRDDMTTAMKARDTLTLGTLRMALAAITTEEVSGDTARELSDADVQKVLAREVRKRKEAAEAFAGAGRAELADKEKAESEVLQAYLPQQLTDDEVAALVAEAVAEVAETVGAAPTMKQMGQVVKLAQAKAAGRAEGGRIAGAVKKALS
ncbi:GatB/YqeY domain-containing protein [Nakamurella sp. YIM 132087]|uniref:GatB/YqeY domain-containing protein n=1 Tax=Nakamurella alba TaxID=2665158 RepID=A0A7K1FEZ4_9ACTN|nr:GatB/YqeY domain-containing protein [Nakamurella alba]MTD12685.1 GatB/YqeY domain-containing protein [Nakamurella alba]